MPASIEVAIIEAPLLLPEEAGPATSGAVCRFVGQTRAQRDSEHGALVALEYHCYQDMAESELHRLAAVAIERWEIDGVRVHHAKGSVAIGEASVIIDVMAPHRERAFLACRWLIDTIKHDVPIWKQERWEDGATWSKGEPLSDGGRGSEA